jgi:hypothetical protein
MPKKSRSMKKMKGGVGAADHAIQVFGDAGAQHAAPGGNVIAMNEVKGGSKMVSLMPAVVGGGKNKGGNVLTDIAVPATLLVANQSIENKEKTEGGNILSDIALPATLVFANQTFGKKESVNKSKSYKKNRSMKNRTRSNRKNKK